MMLINHNKLYVFSLICFLCCTALVSAQEVHRVFASDTRINPEQTNELRIDVDNLSFFRNNEFSGKIMKGYTLPGLWIQPKATYQPLKNVKLELGLHALIYHGTVKYPSLAYTDIEKWKGSHYQKGSHVLPLLRAQIDFTPRFSLILGNIYGGANHRLIEPLYATELNYSADPESGLQLLFNSRWFKFDTWINWQSFIFDDDNHQEVFTVGLSSRIDFTSPESRFHFYMPIQGLIQHRGGEIDTLLTSSVQTLMNGAAGLGLRWNFPNSHFKYVDLEMYGAGYYQQAGNLWPLDSGWGSYAKVSTRYRGFDLSVSYWESEDFISMFGYPYYGSVSTKVEGAVFECPKLITAHLSWTYAFAKNIVFAVNADIYSRLSDNMRLTTGEIEPVAASTGFSVGVSLRINPSFLIKRF